MAPAIGPAALDVAIPGDEPTDRAPLPLRLPNFWQRAHRTSFETGPRRVAIGAAQVAGAGRWALGVLVEWRDRGLLICLSIRGVWVCGRRARNQVAARV